MYESSWGSGSRAAPVAPEEFHAHIREYGWPSVEEVRDGGDGEAAVQANDHTDFDAATRFSLFGIGREPRNLDRTGIGSPGQFNIIEKGFHNWLEFKIGKNLADSGTVMVMAHGPSAKRPGEYDSSVVQVSGVFYAPKVFDVTRNFFVDDRDRMAADVVHPFLVKIVTGNSLTASRSPLHRGQHVR